MFHHSALILTDKPPIEELHQFLEFQLPRQWAPVFSDLPLGPQWKQRSSASLQFSFMGPRLYVNTIPVNLYSSGRLGIQWQTGSASSKHNKSCSCPLVSVGGKLLDQFEEAFRICLYSHVVEPSLANKDASF